MNGKNTDSLGLLLVLTSTAAVFFAIGYLVRRRALVAAQNSNHFTPCEYRVSWMAYAVAIAQFFISAFFILMVNSLAHPDRIVVVFFVALATGFLVAGAFGILTLPKTRAIVREDSVLFEEGYRRREFAVSKLRAVSIQKACFVIEQSDGQKIEIPIVFRDSGRLLAHLNWIMQRSQGSHKGA